VLTIGCLPKGTYFRHCPVLASTTVVELVGAEAAKVVVAATKALASKVSALAGEGPYCSLQLYLGYSFLLNLLLYDFRSFCHCLSPSQMFLHELQTFIFLVEVR
jgi:hypothetical protein